MAACADDFWRSHQIKNIGWWVYSHGKFQNRESHPNRCADHVRLSFDRLGGQLGGIEISRRAYKID
jgi:hypothetical protein